MILPEMNPISMGMVAPAAPMNYKGRYWLRCPRCNANQPFDVFQIILGPWFGASIPFPKRKTLDGKVGKVSEWGICFYCVFAFPLNQEAYDFLKRFYN